MRAGWLTAVALSAWMAGASGASAYSFPTRAPGGPLPDEPPKPLSGWRLGAAMTFPYTAAASLAYWWPSDGPITVKLGGTWGIHDGKATIAGRFSDFRVYGAAMYYLVADAVGGPYVETGLDVVRASGSILPLGWPVMPHLAFGTNGRLSETTGWDVNFSATVNGVLTLDAGYLF